MLETTQLMAADTVARDAKALIDGLQADCQQLGMKDWLDLVATRQRALVASLQHYADVRMYCKDTCEECHCEAGTNTENCSRCARVAWVYSECEKAPDTEPSLFAASKAEYEAWQEEHPDVASQT